MDSFGNYDYAQFGKLIARQHPAEFENFIKERLVSAAKEQVEACQQSLNDALDNLKKTEAM